MKQFTPKRCRADLFKWLPQWNSIPIYASWLLIALFLSFVNVNLNAQAIDLDKILADDGVSHDYFGYSVSISGDQLVVGAHLDDDNGSNSGSVYVYEKQGGVWTYKQKLTAFDGAADDRFGNSVSISGDYLVVGSYYDDDNGIFDSGSAYVYEKQGGVWTYKQKLTAFDGAANDRFGNSVSISGDQLVVGVNFDDDNGDFSGSVYVYEKQGGVWTYKQKLTAFDGAAFDNFGHSVSISGDQLVVGAFGDDDNGSNSGSVYVYEKQGGVWTYKQKLTAFDGAADDRFGNSVSISGDQLVVGANFDDDNGSYSGSVYVYEKQGGVWTYKQKLTAFDGAAFDNFGHSVSISGDQLVVGAFGDDDNGSNSGSVYVYKKQGGVWTYKQKLTAFDGAAFDNFGHSVSISGDQLVVGAYLKNDNGNLYSGSAYVASLAATCTLSLSCPADQTVNTDAGVCEATLNFTDPVMTSSDAAACNPVLTQTAGPSAGTQAAVGPHTLSFEATDDDGNIATCSFTITVEDNEDPMLMCEDIVVELDANGEVSITADQFVVSATDNCTVVTPFFVGNPVKDFTCADVGQSYTRKIRVKDPSDNKKTCEKTVTIEDNIAPDAQCQPFTVQLDAAGNGTLAAADIDNNSADACGIKSLSIDAAYENWECSDIGPHTVTLTVTDNNDNISTCDATVTVDDDIQPTLECEDITVQLAADGTYTLVATESVISYDDNCTITKTPFFPKSSGMDQDTIFDCSDVGNTYELKNRVKDQSNNAKSCIFDVTIEDNVLPDAQCKPFTVQLDATGNGILAADDIDNISADACGIKSLSIESADEEWECSDIGSHTVTLTVTDNNDNISTCDATVTVDDDIQPTLECEDITVQLAADGTYTLVATESVISYDDNCTITKTPFFPKSSGMDQDTIFDCSDVGNTYELKNRVKDQSNNAKSCIFDVTIEDNVLPNAQCKPFTVLLDGFGNGTLAASEIDNNSADACGIKSLSIDAAYENWECSDIGPHTVTLTVTDNNDNVSTCDADVTVVDDISPVIMCQNVIAELDANGEVSITADQFVVSASDNCTLGSPFFRDNPVTDFTCADANQTYNLSIRVKDQSNNNDTCGKTVTIVDNVAPVAQCQNVIVQLDAAGNGSTTATAVDNGSNDACGIATLELSKTDFDCSNVGPNPVTLTVTDVNNNVSDCPAVVTVEDNVAAEALCQNVTVQLDAAGNGSTTATAVDNGSNDACGIALLELSTTAFDCSNVGPNPVTLTVTDVNNNVSDCPAVVTVEDNVAAEALCQNVTVQLDAAGNGSTTATAVDNGSNDACGIALLELSTTAFDCSNVGPNPVTLTVTDVNNNVSDCPAVVTVEDNVAAEALCQNVTVQLDAAGNGSTTATAVDNGSNDACGIATLELSKTDFDCSNVGPNPVTLTVTDVNNNVSDCPAVVTVEDNVAAEALCQNVTVQLDAAGNGSTTATAVDNGSNDACGIALLELSKTAFDCSNVGPNPVTLTVTDVNNNVSDCPAVVTVEDNVAAEALCQNVTVQLDAAGNGSTTATAVDNGSNDACGIATLELSKTDFDCSNVGPNPVTLTVTDVNNNVSDCPAVVTVEDNVAAEALCQNVTVQLDAAGNGSTTATAVDNGSNDACGIATLELSKTDFDCSNVGPNPVTLTVTDVNNNVSDCPAVVTVEDNVAAEALCQNVTVQLDAAGNGSTTAAVVDNGSDDACGIATLELSKTAFDCSNVGPNPVTLTVTDVNNNVSTCDATVTVEDNVAAEALCQDVTVQLDAAGNGSTTAAAVDNGSNDACGINLLELSKTAFDCSNVGPNPVTLTVTDVNNNVSTCDAVVTVEDNLAPIMTCPDVTINLDPGFCGANVTYEVTATDNCGVASNVLVSGPASGDYLDYHDSSWDVVWEAIDVNGNATQCAFTIEIFEYANPTPVLTCNDNLQISIDPQGSGILGADMILEGGPYGCYDDYIVTIDGASNELDCSMIGEGSIMVMVEDPDTGNTCWGSIIVEDKIGPDCVTVSDYTVDCEEGLPADTDPVYWPTFGDNCAVAEVNLVSETVLNSDICTDITVERVWTAVDASGNTANTNCVQTITITRGSILLPTDIDFDCTNYTLEDLVPALTGFPEGGATSCGYSYTYTDAVFDGCGNTAAITRTWSILDECSSAVTTHVQLISLIDIQGPSITYNDITVSANVTVAHPQPCLSTAIIPTNAAVSDCSDVVSVRYFTSVGEVINGSIPAPGLPIGEHTLTITAEDACGNTSSEDFTITVIDGIAPTPVCKEITQISLSTDGTAVVPAESFDNGSYDNCCLDYIEVRRMDETTYGPTVSFDCTDETVEVVLRAVDCYENDNTCMVVALVEDKLAPTCTAPADVTGVDCDVYYSELAAALANEDYSVLEVYGQGTTADNCTLVSDYTVSYDVDECGNGTITRTWTANDAAENQTAVCKQDIFIVHNSNWTVAFSAVDQVEVECADAEIEELAPVITNDACEMIATSYTDTHLR
jgi:Ni,Fe-hydrogenase III small subunit